MGKKALFTALSAALVAVATGLAWQASVRLWRMVMHEEPPKVPWWGKFLVRKPVHGKIAGLLRAPT